jgi:hypothetical protein
MSPIEVGCGKIGKMARGGKGDRRRANVIGNAVKVMGVATGEETGSAGQESAARTKSRES